MPFRVLGLVGGGIVLWRGAPNCKACLGVSSSPRLSILISSGKSAATCALDGELPCLVMKWWDWIGVGIGEGADVFSLQFCFIPYFFSFPSPPIFSLSLQNLQMERSAGALHPWHSPRLLLIKWRCENCLLLCGLSVGMVSERDCNWTSSTTVCLLFLLCLYEVLTKWISLILIVSFYYPVSTVILKFLQHQYGKCT